LFLRCGFIRYSPRPNEPFFDNQDIEKKHMPLSTKQVADLLKITQVAVGTAIRQGRLKAVRLGREYMILRGDLEAYIRDHQRPFKINVFI